MCLWPKLKAENQRNTFAIDVEYKAEVQREIRNQGEERLQGKFGIMKEGKEELSFVSQHEM